MLAAMSSSDDARKNRECWDSIAEDYQAKHGPQLNREPLAWGAWARPEADLQVLGEVADLDVLELGCGAAQWTGFLARAGARVTGLDQSAEQLEHGRSFLAGLGVAPPLVLADAEQLPFAESVFDLVFCDHGAMTFADPRRTVPEVARVLRPGGLFAFCHMTTLAYCCWDEEAGKTVPTLQHDWFTAGRFEDEDHVSHALPTGEWIRLFRANGFLVEDLLELRPPEGGDTTYDAFVHRDWAERWPAEEIWRLRRED
jgi:SAM-dependent methyltransferase